MAERDARGGERARIAPETPFHRSPKVFGEELGVVDRHERAAGLE